MKSRANTLLVELLLVIFCFLFASMTLVELFGAAKGRSLDSKAVSESALDTQNIAELLYLAENPEEELISMGFVQEEGVWTLKREYYSLRVMPETETMEAGILRTLTVSAERNNETIITIPSVRYWPEEGTP